MKELKTWFEVSDFFGGSPNPNYFYEKAVKHAEEQGVTFSKELWYETQQRLGEENIDLSFAEEY